MLNILARSRNFIAAGRCGYFVAALLLALLSGQASAETEKKINFEFVNVADSNQGLVDFSQFPAINNRGEVAFVATQTGTGQGVFKWERHGLRPIASTSGSNFTFFTDDVVINSAGVVGFRANLNTGPRVTGIFTSNGFTTKTIVDSADPALGLSGPGIGSPSINSNGTVAFEAFRNGFRSALIFAGDGKSLTPVLDTLNSDFAGFGVVAINRSGDIVFRGFPKDGSEGIFVVRSAAKKEKDEKETSESASSAPADVVDIIDSNNPDFFQFGDPVINDAGVVADFAGTAQGLEILTGNSRGITPRTDPTSGFFIDMEHPSINRHGAVAFSVIEATGAQGIFVELTGGASPIAVLQSGDPLFGSTVTAVKVGRFAFNDHFRLAFQYELADGRSGIAVASLQSDADGRGEKSENEDEDEK